jgi:hypothetical protein
MPQSDEFRSNVNHHDVFISYAQLDKPIADAVCAKLESRHIRCWIAPRDVPPGKNFPEAIIDAIEESKIVTLIFSSHSNNSPHVLREVTKAVNKGCIIVPFRVEDVVPSKSMEYLISVPHWLDAITPPLEKHIDELAGNVERILLSSKQPAVCTSCKTPLSGNALFCENCGMSVTAMVPSVATPPPPPVFAPPAPPLPVEERPPPVAGPVPEEPSPEKPHIQPPPHTPETPPVPVAAPPSLPSRNRKMLIGAGAVVILLIALFIVFPVITGSQMPFGNLGSGVVEPQGPAPVTNPIDYRSGNAPVNTVVLSPGPTQTLPGESQLFVQAEKNAITAEVPVRFEGGTAMGTVLNNRVILTRSDGTVTEGKLDFSRRQSEIVLQGTRGTDRLQVIVTLHSGSTFTIVDKLIPYPERMSTK